MIYITCMFPGFRQTFQKVDQCRDKTVHLRNLISSLIVTVLIHILKSSTRVFHVYPPHHHHTHTLCLCVFIHVCIYMWVFGWVCKNVWCKYGVFFCTNDICFHLLYGIFLYNEKRMYDFFSLFFIVFSSVWCI